MEMRKLPFYSSSETDDDILNSSQILFERVGYQGRGSIFVRMKCRAGMRWDQDHKLSRNFLLEVLTAELYQDQQRRQKSLTRSQHRHSLSHKNQKPKHKTQTHYID